VPYSMELKAWEVFYVQSLAINAGCLGDKHDEIQFQTNFECKK
jgi:hypothetical protein